MTQSSPDRQQIIDELVRRHGFSPEAVASMLQSVVNGGGGMAQFDHPEFGGGGQWMRGGMTMVSDMFNGALKARVVALCNDLAGAVADRPAASPPGLQSQYTGTADAIATPSTRDGGNWWPGELGAPNSTGAQNGVRYAYFGQARRLAIEVEGKVTLYDTQDHQIGGVAQQQSRDRSLTFTSQHGPIDIDRLPVITGD